ncbi:hypothetical protein [Phenylobacterium sp.]|uniref:hypothetical protein n=1 Tax=Phenylobacterium sp. TaxID=1871053 RepID=UPI002FE1786D
MAKDPSEDMSTPQLVAQSGFPGRHVLLAGVVGACALGVGAGLWARPAADERRATPAQARPAVAAKPAGRLEIVLDDSPAPIGAPIEVLPAFGSRAPEAPLVAAPPVEPVPLAPVRPPAGLVRVQAVEPIAVEPEPLPPPKPVVKPAAEPAKKVEKKPVAAKKPERTQAPAKPKRPAADRRVAKAQAAPEKASARADRPGKTKLAKAAAEKPANAAETKKSGKSGKTLAKVTPKKVQDAAKVSKAKLSETRKARAEAARLEKAKAEKARVQKAKLEKAKLEKAKLEKVRIAKAQEAKARDAKAREAKAREAKARAERAKVVKAAAPKPPPPAAQPKVPKPTRDNPIRKASTRCASADPGEAIVCADPSLGAADRQLARAYRQAEAAGVSTAQLARQQQRWLAARAQAAREAPWAVRDVYEARIAELNDMTRGARGEY